MKISLKDIRNLIYLSLLFTVVSFAAVVWSCNTMPSISRLRESMFCDETKYCLQKRLCLLPFLQQRKNQNYSSMVSYLKNIIPCNFTMKSKLTLCCTSNRPLIGCCLSGLYPLCVNYVIKWTLF